MLLVMKQNAAQEQIDAVIEQVNAAGYTARPIPGGHRTAIGVLHNKGPVDPARFQGMPGVKELIPVTRPYKLVSRETKPENTVVRIGDIAIGEGRPVLMAGPCAIESLDQALTIAGHVKQAGAEMFRGGAFKPRTSPYSFQGLGEEGLKIMAQVREETGLKIVTEAVDHEVFDLVEGYADMVQIGARSMQNFSLLRRAGQSSRPVMIKRGMSATIEEWLMAAEYVMEQGNDQVVLCERGLRTFAMHSRNTLDLSAVCVVRKESHLPIIVDPSHAGGHRGQVGPLSRASAAIGVDGLMIEVHHDPASALSDGGQSLYPDQFRKLAGSIFEIHDLVSRQGNL